MYIPIYIKKYNIYDIYHNDNNNLIIISPMENNILNIKYGDNNFTTHICSHNHTFVYILDIETIYIKNIKLSINEEILETNVNKYPEFKNEIIMSTIILNEDDYIKQWINFHLNIGITRFIIYDNSSNNTLENILKYFINNNIVILIKWNYNFYLPNSGISGQTTQQSHSIWAFKNSKYIGLFDIDEYINMQNNYQNIDIFFNDLIINEKINIENTGGFQLLNKLFFNPYNLPTNDYEFLKIYNCDNILLVGREKLFVIPKNVYTYSIHCITKGKNSYNVSHEKIFFNHYIFLNKSERGRNITDITDITDNTISNHCTNLL